MAFEEGTNIMNHRLRLGIVLMCVGVMLFFWSIWLVSWTYDAYSTHCDTIDLWSKFGIAAVALMLIGTILFSGGMFFATTSDREADASQFQQRPIG